MLKFRRNRPESPEYQGSKRITDQQANRSGQQLRPGQAPVDPSMRHLIDEARRDLSEEVYDEVDVAKLSASIRRRMRGKPTRPATQYNLLTGLGLSVFGLIKVFFLLAFALVVFAGSLGFGALIGNITMTDELPASLLLSRGGSETSFAYDAEGNLVAKITGADNIDREYIPLSEISDGYLLDAFIATEDERFESNIGISPRRIASAVISAVTHGGQAAHGGSTITQQTIKLLTGQDQRSVQRKLQEWYRAIILTHQLSKSEILELYVNLVPLANSYVGVQSASKAYFAKPASELSLAEAAYLAGMPKSPTIYNPRSERGRRNGMRRQRQVLANMYHLGRITDDEYRQALNQDLHFSDKPMEVSTTDINSYFVEYAVKQVRNDLMRKLDYSELAAGQMIGSGGLRIYLTWDPKAQAILDRVYADHNNFETNPAIYDGQPERPQSGGVLINNETHAVVAIAGGVGEKTQNLVINRGTDIQRQPGSTIKPVGVYAPAIDLGVITGCSLMSDTAKALDPQNPDTIWPYNYNRSFSGSVLARFALKESLNTVAVQTLALLDVENAKYYLAKNGWNMDGDESQLGLAVGAMTHGISPLELANSFATFTSGGVHHTPTLYTRVEDSDGNLILDTPDESTEVFKPSTAFIMTSILEEVTRTQLSNSPHWGVAARYGQIQNSNGEVIQTGVKTGTTDNAVDQWACGFTPYYTFGLWYGFDNRVKTSYIPSIDNYKCLDVFYQVMREIHQDLPARSFEQPGDVVAVDVSAYTGLRASQGTYNSGTAYREYFDIDSDLIPSQYDYYQPAETEEENSDTPNSNEGN
ncbi:MAG: transglycosylase domain-containing protein [Eubacteriales bacterium]|nr:transglycosylase domain-containing protein [Eubacteriales bacterium]